MNSYLGSPFLALRRALLFLGFTFICMPVQLVAIGLNLEIKRSFPLWYHQRVCRWMGLAVEVRGKQSSEHPTLYVCNHISYWDIPVLASLIKGCFVAKAEVATWPFFSWLAKLQRSVFVERRAVKTAEQRDEMSRRLEEGDDLILFPEGTSGDGQRVRPFKSGFFSVAQREVKGRQILVQPVSISYTRLDDFPMGRFLRPYFAWYGDMDLGPHLWESLGMGRVTVVVEFHEPVHFADFASRKALSAYAYSKISCGVSDALAGRGQLPAKAKTLELEAGDSKEALPLA